MKESQRLAIAAHMHVMLRRKTGRVTDTEWMAKNVEYAAEIVRYARTRAREDVLPELADLADRLQEAMFPAAPVPAPTAAAATSDGGNLLARYVGRLR
ncbi:hypothetical protein [Ottowia thiooxydans]|uniref:hypothetical protein n=1 Tax=Ottowia thiooxydans TaxID=219182 RepID=UPI00040A8F66|nr:hypothetical protein [Ottowia thiooxydans]